MPMHPPCMNRVYGSSEFLRREGAPRGCPADPWHLKKSPSRMDCITCNGARIGISYTSMRIYKARVTSRASECVAVCRAVACWCDHRARRCTVGMRRRCCPGRASPHPRRVGARGRPRWHDHRTSDNATDHGRARQGVPLANRRGTGVPPLRWSHALAHRVALRPSCSSFRDEAQHLGQAARGTSSSRGTRRPTRLHAAITIPDRSGCHSSALRVGRCE